MQNKRGKRGQITIFVILAIIIIAIVLIIFLYPEIQTRFFQAPDPNSYLKSCVEEELKESLEMVMQQGGSLNPKNYVLYENKKVEYLCYINEDYQTCIMQQPLLLQHIEAEVKENIEPKIRKCAASLKKELEEKGYNVQAGTAKTSVSIIPDNIIIIVDYPLTVSKETTSNYKSFEYSIKSEAYDLIMIATSILNYEAHYGGAESTVYMTYYPSVKVEQKKLSERGTVYILTDRDTGESLYFASKSLNWPAGYSG